MGYASRILIDQIEGQLQIIGEHLCRGPKIGQRLVERRQLKTVVGVVDRYEDLLTANGIAWAQWRELSYCALKTAGQDVAGVIRHGTTDRDVVRNGCRDLDDQEQAAEVDNWDHAAAISRTGDPQIVSERVVPAVALRSELGDDTFDEPELKLAVFSFKSITAAGGAVWQNTGLLRHACRFQDALAIQHT